MVVGLQGVGKRARQAIARAMQHSDMPADAGAEGLVNLERVGAAEVLKRSDIPSKELGNCMNALDPLVTPGGVTRSSCGARYGNDLLGSWWTRRRATTCWPPSLFWGRRAWRACWGPSPTRVPPGARCVWAYSKIGPHCGNCGGVFGATWSCASRSSVGTWCLRGAICPICTPSCSVHQKRAHEQGFSQRCYRLLRDCAR